MAEAPNVILESLARGEREDPEEKSDLNDPTFRMARALLQLAKSKSASFRETFHRDWLFLLGENHNPIPANAVAARAQSGKNQGIRNWLFATCSQKAEIILGAKPKYTAVPYGGPVDFYDRWRAQEAIEEIHRQMRAEQFDEDCLWDGMATGKGYTRVIVKEDPRSGQARTELEDADPGRVYPDPTASRLEDCDYLFYEPWMTMPQIREAFPLSWHKVKPEQQGIGAEGDRRRIGGPSRTDTQIIMSGAGYEFAADEKGEIQSLGANVAFLWIRNEEVLEELETRILHGEREAYSCARCGDIFERPLTEMPSIEDEIEEAIIPDAITCPTCGSDAVASVVIPAETEDVPIERRFKYPYGRMIVTTKDGILWGDPELGEGLNPDKIDHIFPIFEYHHYRVPKRFSGFGEVAHLKTAQVNANKNMQQLMAYLRTAVNGVLEYPSRAGQYQNLSNLPNPKIGLPPNLIGLARYLPPAPFNIQAFMVAEDTIRRDFQEMAGITDVVFGLAPTAPTSGKEVIARREAATTRIEGHIRRFNQYRSARGTAVWQLNWQHARSPRYYAVRNSDGEAEMALLTLQSMPRNMKVHVSADPDDAQRGELVGQTLQGLMTSGLLPTWFDLLLPTMGLHTYEADTITDRMKLRSYEEEQLAATEDEDVLFGAEEPSLVPA